MVPGNVLWTAALLAGKILDCVVNEAKLPQVYESLTRPPAIPESMSL